jgi:hypothetical protein
MKRPHDDESDDESCVDLTEEPPADVKPKLPEPHVFDVDEDPVQAPIRRGLLLRSTHSGFYAARSTNKNNGRQSSRVLLVARQFEGGVRHDTPLLLAESDIFVRGEARQFLLRGPAVSRRGEVARELGLELKIGHIDITSDNEEIAVIVAADGVVETRSGSRLRRVGELSFDEGEEGPTVSVYSTKFLAKALHPNAMDHKDPDLDGSVLVEASALDFDVVAGVDESQ